VAAAAGVATALAGRTTFHAPAGTAVLARALDESIPATLREHHVPGAAIAVVHDGRTVLAKGYGDARRDTRFQVASVSKPVSALGIVRLAEARDVPLDAPIALRGWDPPGGTGGVTLRRLLSHTAGTNVPGYLGTDPSQLLPSLTDSVRSVRVVRKPGTGYAYSGGGYSVAQLWAQETSEEPFARLMRDTVLWPLGMDASTFEQTDAPQDATPHDAAGRPIPAYRYAELAAAGLRSTATDMARFAAALLPGPRGAPPVVPAEMTRAAPATGGVYGIGFELETLDDGTRVVEHVGASRGWRSHLVAYPDRGWAIVVLTDGDGGEAVAAEAIRQLAG
jgi:CubicO group peptidase (beta-lactamase class C family)